MACGGKNRQALQASRLKATNGLKKMGAYDGNWELMKAVAWFQNADVQKNFLATLHPTQQSSPGYHVRHTFVPTGPLGQVRQWTFMGGGKKSNGMKKGIL